MELLSAVVGGSCSVAGRAPTGSCVGGESRDSWATDRAERNAKRKAAASKRMSDLIEAAWDESECTPTLSVPVHSTRQKKCRDRAGKAGKLKGFGTSG